MKGKQSARLEPGLCLKGEDARPGLLMEQTPHSHFLSQTDQDPSQAGKSALNPTWGPEQASSTNQDRCYLMA